ncbi:hypothetical protein [Bacillus sp. EB600]|nr:hypothetical protein [Bacillus sp. EB600]MCQ6279550.1 hypothetical protein [Bacillus sp. EB600]
MSHKCFYCTNDIEENEIHFVTFDMTTIEKEEVLCHECYQEWLQGIKG